MRRYGSYGKNGNYGIGVDLVDIVDAVGIVDKHGVSLVGAENWELSIKNYDGQKNSHIPITDKL